MLNKIKTLIAVAVLSGTVSANAEAATVTVHKGDTLWDLSRVHNTSVENIQKLNHLTTDLIHPGDALTIAPEKHYTVKQGDTLWDIAQTNHISVSQLMDWNNLISDLIHPGLNLLIFDGVNSETEKPVDSAAPTASVPSSTSAAAPVPAPQPTAQAPKPAAPAPQPAVQAPKPAAPAPQPAAQAPQPAAQANNTGAKKITVKATAYTASCEGCSGITATGVNIKDNPNEKVIAVDPSVIPLGSKVYVEGVGEATAADTGGAIKGNRIDVFIPSEQDAVNFGVKQLTVTILN